VNTDRPLRIGTRGSALALWQARHVAALLAALPGAPATASVILKTAGDRITEVPLSQVAGKAFFTKEIEEALLAGEVDLAVHSQKDLATEMPAGLAIAAVLEREDPRDAWLSPWGASGPGIEQLASGARVGTSSLRRRALLARWRPDLEIAELRGNVPTRVDRLLAGEFDAIVLAAAGLRRLGLERRITALLPVERWLPAVAQGAVAVQVRAGDERTAGWVRRLDDPATRAATTAERALLRRLEGGCQIPVGALATVKDGGIRLQGSVCSLDGRRSVEGERRGTMAEAQRVGAALAEELIAGGAGEILAAIRGFVPGGA
jgi:hydroxymethylbilane synthase